MKAMTSPFSKEKSEKSDNVQLELPSSVDKAKQLQIETQQKLQAKAIEALNLITNFDWKAVPPPVLAQMLVQIPFKGGQGEPDYFLQPWQAMIFAMRCYELGLSPFSNEVWFNPKNNKVNVTFEGKLKLAHKMGLNLSPPVLTREPPDKNKPLISYTCLINSPSGPCQYTAVYKDWVQPKSPVWKEKPEHMLQLRAAEKCLSFASGIGSSELMGEQDLQVGEEASKAMPQIEVSPFEFKPDSNDVEHANSNSIHKH
jgi:hypothetical protein